MNEKEFLIFRTNFRRHRYAVHLTFKDEDELKKAVEALKPLGYSFRFPKGR